MELARRFPGGDIYIIEEEDKFCLAGAELDALSDDSCVYKRSMKALDEFRVVTHLYSGGLRPLSVNAVLQIHPDGSRNRNVFAGPITASVRARIATVASSTGDTAQPLTTKAQKVLKLTQSHEYLQKALNRWAESPQSFRGLGVILDDIEAFLGGLENRRYLRADQTNPQLCTPQERDLFDKTADNPGASGEAARHGGQPGREPPSNPMIFSDGKALIERILKGAIDIGLKS